MSYERHIEATKGYLTLGMLDEAALEIEEIPYEDRHTEELSALRVELYSKAGKWNVALTFAKQLCENCPDNIKYRKALENATRQLKLSKPSILNGPGI